MNNALHTRNGNKTTELLLRVLECARSVHSNLGMWGALEINKLSLANELSTNLIKYENIIRMPYPSFCRSIHEFRTALIIEGKIFVEIKPIFGPDDRRLMLPIFKSNKTLEVALLLFFCSSDLRYKIITKSNNAGNHLSLLSTCL